MIEGDKGLFKKFFSSSYVKAALVLLCSGAILIIFSNWVNKSKITIGFETINDVLMPVYIGIVCAFLLYPIYNSTVKHAYKFFCNNNKRPAQLSNVGTGAFIIAKYEGLTTEEDNRRSLQAARFVATVVCLIVLLGIVSAIAYFLIPQVIESAITLATTLPEKLELFSVWLTGTFTRFPDVTEKVNMLTNAGATELLKWLQEHLLNEDAMALATTISTSIFSIIGVVVDIFIGILIMVYLLNNKDMIFAIGRKLVAAVFSERKSRSIFEFAGIINETFLNFISGRIIDSAIIGVLTYCTLAICGISFAPMISVLVGVTNIIPFFGPFIGAIPSVLILLIESPRQALYFIIIILIIQQIDGNIIGPKIVGNAIGISSFWVLISVLIGGGLFGFLGMALGVPVFAVIYRYVDRMAINSLSRKDLATSTEDYYTLEQYDIDKSEIAKPQTKKKKKRKHKSKHIEVHTPEPEVKEPEAIEESMLIDTTEEI